MKSDNPEKEQERYFTAWHPIFSYVLDRYLPEDIFDIITEVEIGKLPLKIDFIIIKKLKTDRVELPDYLNFLNDYKYAVLEYKSPNDYFNFYDFLQLLSYSKLYCVKEQIEELNTVIRVGVFSNTSKNLLLLLEKNGYGIKEIDKGFNYIENKTESCYLLNLEELRTKEKDLLISIFSKSEEIRAKTLEELKESETAGNFGEYIEYLIKKENIMSMINRDKGFAKWMEEGGLLGHITVEERLKGLKPEEIVINLKPEDRLKGLKPEDRLKGLKPEDRLKGLKPEEIEIYLSKVKKDMNDIK